ncbi:YtzH-like family protein [Oceanobacillus senegalensis]|uniref:YtzH-like family protein n=1 Tax=Oceanobacillus senegalensis TaxID=1936063 RepID=UPI000A311390|nr:YtzH-like family protein [Oceanobacillus senegalensis]
MTLNTNNLLTLLHDILDEQSVGCCGEVSEYQQIRRLVKNMMSNNEITNEQLLQLLPEIYNYGRQGENAQNIEEHITVNKNNLKTWMSAIEHVNLQ